MNFSIISLKFQWKNLSQHFEMSAYGIGVVLYIGLLFHAIHIFNTGSNSTVIGSILFLVILQLQGSYTRLRRLLSVILTVYMICALWGFLLEGRFFGEGFWAHVGVGNFSYLLLYRSQIIYSSALLVCAVSLVFLKPRKEIAFKLPIWLLALFFAFGPLRTTFDSAQLFISKLNFIDPGDLGKSVLPRSEQFFKAYVSGKKTAAPKNILFIVMEGIEQEYLNETKFPGLMPNLTNLQKEGLSFKNFHQQPGAWTTGGLLASTCGIYINALSSSVFGNDVLQSVPTARLNCLGDMLGKEGWNNYFFQGTDLRFANLGRIFTDHDTMVFGIEKFAPEEQHSAGAYDRYLFKNIQNFITGPLQQKGQPFFLSFINFDTHAPGFIDVNCPSYDSDDDIVKATHCYDHQLGSFIAKLKESPIWKNTLVFIFNDHLSMAKFSEMNWNQRRNFLLLLGAGHGEVDQRIYHVDIPKIAAGLVLEDLQAFPLSANPLKSQEGNKFTFDDQMTKGLIYLMEKSLQ